jgi:hypothetical protein
MVAGKGLMWIPVGGILQCGKARRSAWWQGTEVSMPLTQGGSWSVVGWLMECDLWVGRWLVECDPCVRWLMECDLWVGRWLVECDPCVWWLMECDVCATHLRWLVEWDLWVGQCTPCDLLCSSCFTIGCAKFPKDLPTCSLIGVVYIIKAVPGRAVAYPLCCCRASMFAGPHPW